MSPALAADANGGALAMWGQYDGSANTFIEMASRYASSGWAAPSKPLGTKSGTDRFIYPPSLGLDVKGNAIATWSQGSPSTVVIDHNASTGKWDASPSPLSDGSGDAAYPFVVVSSNGSAVAAWSQLAGTTYNLYVTRYVSSIGKWDPPTPAIADGTTSALSVAMAMAPNGSIVAVWIQQDSGGSTYSLWGNTFQ
jgi:hypothetical protein